MHGLAYAEFGLFEYRLLFKWDRQRSYQIPDHSKIVWTNAAIKSINNDEKE